MREIECFKIRLLKSEKDNLWNISTMTPIHDILCEQHPLSTNPITIVADPFLFVHDNELFLFYEEKRNYSFGTIKMSKTKDLKNWTKPITVLKEDFHLSFPFVFKEGDNIYIIPESSDVGDIRLYKADNDKLNSFSFHKTLISKEVTNDEIGYADSSIYKKDGTYYLMSSIEKQGTNVLYLFFSDSLEGPYIEHPCSPINTDRKYGRNAGCLLESNNKIYRVAQDCEVHYGDNVHLFQIDELSKKTYKEHLVKSNLISNTIPFYHDGGHQYNFTNYNNVIVIATDSKEYHLFTVYRILHKTITTLYKILKKFFPH